RWPFSRPSGRRRADGSGAGRIPHPREWRSSCSRSSPQKKGSSRFTGKGGLDLEEEVVAVSVAVGGALDDLDAVVHPLEDTRVQGVKRAGEDAVEVGLEALGEGDQRLEPAVDGHAVPLLPAPTGLSFAWGIPQLL